MTRAIVIGAGHNGLTAAALLARRGVRVTVVEARSNAGGMMTPEEFAPGFRAPGLAQFVYRLQREVVNSLKLEKHGLDFSATGLSTVALSDAGDHISYDPGTLIGHGISTRDQAAFIEFNRQMQAFGGVLASLNHRRPPRLGNGDRHDKLGLARLAYDVRTLGRDDMRQLLRVGASNVYDVLNEWFEHEGLKGALAFDAVLGSHAGPRSANSMLTYLHRRSGTFGALAQPRFSSDALSSAFVAAAQSQGVTLRTASPVASVNVTGGRASGVTLSDGQSLDADIVVSNVDPRTTVLKLVGARHFDTGFVRRIHHLRMHGNAARLNLALSAKPTVPGLQLGDYAQRLVIAPDADRVERAFNPAKYGQWSNEAVMEISLPTLSDPALAPEGRHVLSATVQFAPYRLREGWTDNSKARFVVQLTNQLERYMPGISKLVEASQLLSPVDIEQRYGVQGGHWHHGELALDQFLFVRPTYGAAQYALPLDGLYLCGAGAHPGGGISGAAGRNCALEIIRTEGGV